MSYVCHPSQISHMVKIFLFVNEDSVLLNELYSSSTGSGKLKESQRLHSGAWVSVRYPKSWGRSVSRRFPKWSPEGLALTPEFGSQRKKVELSGCAPPPKKIRISFPHIYRDVGRRFCPLAIQARTDWWQCGGRQFSEGCELFLWLSKGWGELLHMWGACLMSGPL